MEQRATFTRMDEGTKEDWQIIAAHNGEFARGLPDRVLDHLRLLKGDAGGFAVDRLEHSLQTATLAENAGKDEEYVVCALLHDIGDVLGSYNHADIAATILQPFVSEENHWIVAHHGIFQGYYFFHYLGLDRNQRDQFRDHPFYEACAAFCRLDQAAFDPDFESKPLEHFEPMVRRVLAQPKRSLYMAS
ncbi:MAG TPA: HD domain-containing protein [Pseudomonadales bacterium]|nr:HD domain-containing protein [Pseudomonadales bacterium]